MAFQTQTRRTILALLVASFFTSLSWTALVPLWHTPDEQAHFAQAQDYAAIGERPNPDPSTSQDIVASEQFLGTFRDNLGNNRFTYHPEYRIPYTNSLDGFHEKEIKEFPVALRQVFLTREATGYPPLYYWYIAVVNNIFWHQDLITRVFLSRMATVLVTTVAVFVSFILASAVFKRSSYAIASATLVAFQPMWKFVGSGVTSDALINLIYPLGVLLAYRLWTAPTRKNFWFFLALAGGGLLTKPQAVFLLVLLIPILSVVMAGKRSLPQPERWLGKLFLVAVAAVTVLVTVNHTSLGRQYPQIFGRFFIPEVDDNVFLQNHPTVGEYVTVMGEELYRQVFPWYWGVYRWLSLTLPIDIYRIIKIIVLLSLVGWMTSLVRNQSMVTAIRRRAVLFLLASSLIYAIGLLAWNFFFWKSHGYSLGIQGRYFFPNLPEHMILLLGGLLLLSPRAWRRMVVMASTMSMVIFNWYSLWFVSTSYYQSSTLWLFLTQASQYKPWFFKWPILPGILGLGLISSVWFLWEMMRYTRTQEHKNA